MSEEDARFWSQLEALPEGAALPHDLPHRFYFRLSSYLAAGTYMDRLRPYLRLFPREK